MGATIVPRLRSADRRTLMTGVLVLTAVFSVPARADVGLCGSFPAPSSDVSALRQAPFAFGGVAIGGRAVSDDEGDEVLVSPFTFRVTRWLKRGSAVAVAHPGADEVSIWDGRYARLPDGLLTRYSDHLGTRFHGEIEAFHGQVWRIYGTNENGVNFTCRDLLGSHPVARSGRPDPTSPGTRGGPSASSPPGTGRGPLFGFVLFGVGTATVLTWVLARRRGVH